MVVVNDGEDHGKRPGGGANGRHKCVYTPGFTHQRRGGQTRRIDGLRAATPKTVVAVVAEKKLVSTAVNLIFLELGEDLGADFGFPSVSGLWLF